MMNFALRTTVPLAVALVFLATGCAQTRRYNVQVMNSTDGPLTIGLVKEGDPFEPHLASPEQAAIGTPSSDENIWPKTVIDRGRIGSTRVEGRFKSNAELLLRVYGGDRTVSEVLSISRGTPERTEAVLRPEPAMNKFVVTRRAGRLLADPVEHFPPQAATTTTTTTTQRAE